MIAGHMPFLAVSSGSMAPLFRVGDEVGVQPVKLHQLHVGDVVVICDHNQLLTHRFWGRQPGGSNTEFRTRGDRSLTYDRPWSEYQLLGRVVVRRRQHNLLWLDYGLGRWLNGRLARLAQHEQRWLGSFPFLWIARRNQLMTSRLFRVFMRTWATALTVAVEKFARPAQSPSSRSSRF